MADGSHGFASADDSGSHTPGAGPFGKLRRWYAILLLAQGLTAAATAETLERDPHAIGRWASAFGEGGPPFSRGQALRP